MNKFLTTPHLLDLLASAAVDAGEELLEAAGHVRSTAVHDGRVALRKELISARTQIGSKRDCTYFVDLARMVEDDDLRGEALGLARRVVLLLARDVSPADVLHRNVLHTEADVAARLGLRDRGVVLFDRPHLAFGTRRREGEGHVRLQDAGLDAAYRHLKRSLIRSSQVSGRVVVVVVVVAVFFFHISSISHRSK